MKSFRDALLQTASNGFIESSDRKMLLSRAEKVEIDAQDYQRVRSDLFNAVREQSLSLDWLEAAMKVLDKAREISMTSEAFFSPENSGQEELERQLRDARKALWVCVFTISDDDLAQALIDQHRKGLDVKVITDNDKIYDRGSDIIDMKKAGVPVKIDDTRHHMHHKFAIVDHEILINGSYNWTRSADEYNHENLIITRDEALVKAFRTEFNALWKELDKL